MPGVEVVVPLGGDCRHRAAAWQWAGRRYDWPVVEAFAGVRPWQKARAVMPAIHASRAAIVVVADADVWCTGVAEAVEAVEHGAAWAIPHNLVHRLTPEGTARLLGGDDPRDLPVTQRPYRGIPGGGYVVAPRDVLLAVPLDPRFTGWGQEDESWGFALECLLGRPWRGRADLIHLWHPPQPRLSRRRGSQTGWALRQRYVVAYRSPAAMRRLLEEITPCHSPAC